MKDNKQYLVLIVLFSLLLLSCTPYYVKHQQFFSLIKSENYTQAEQLIASSKKAKKKRYKLLYLLERGHVSFLQKNFKASSSFFLQADELASTIEKQASVEILAYLTNSNIRPYRAESFEKVMMHYYHALSYVELGNYESALIECRRMNIVLQKLTEASSKESRYTRDAFGHLLMGSIYEISGDVNNAFVAYRNALDAYDDLYTKLFNVGVPSTLKRGVIETALKLGFDEEARQYSQKFDIDLASFDKKSKSELILFLEYGWGAYKVGDSFDFVFSENNDMINFTNPATGLAYNFPRTSVSSQDILNMKSINVFRIAFPRYVQSPDVFRKNKVWVNNKPVNLDVVQPLSQIAQQSLRDRFTKELGEAILRFALKKASEYALRQENQDVGAIFGIANALSEQADTRNWQTLPSSIHQIRIPLSEGMNTISIDSETMQGSSRRDVLSVEAKAGRKYIKSLRLITSIK